MFRNNRGIALIITLTIITVILAITFELNRQMRASVTDAAATRDYMTLSHMVGSGVEIANAILVKDKNETEIDSIQEEWADTRVVDEYLAQVPFEKGKISLEITDERSRIQINALVNYPEGRDFNPPQQELWKRFFALLLTQQELADDSLFSEPLVPDMIINPVKDWLDWNDDDAITGLTGAENAYYQDLDPPYSCRNGPFKDISELLRVKNITPELFSSFEENVPGISNYITVYGMTPLEGDQHRFTYDGKININTAEAPVIAALLPLGEEFLAEEIVAYRDEKTNDEYLHDLTGANWYKEAPGAGDVEIKSELVTTSSDLFRIVCRAELEETAMTATVTVMREKEEETGKWRCRVLNWKYE